MAELVDNIPTKAACGYNAPVTSLLALIPGCCPGRLCPYDSRTVTLIWLTDPHHCDYTSTPPLTYPSHSSLEPLHPKNFITHIFVIPLSDAPIHFCKHLPRHQKRKKLFVLCLSSDLLSPNLTGYLEKSMFSCGGSGQQSISSSNVLRVHNAPVPSNLTFHLSFCLHRSFPFHHASLRWRWNQACRWENMTRKHIPSSTNVVCLKTSRPASTLYVIGTAMVTNTRTILAKFQ